MNSAWPPSLRDPQAYLEDVGRGTARLGSPTCHRQQARRRRPGSAEEVVDLEHAVRATPCATCTSPGLRGGETRPASRSPTSDVPRDERAGAAALHAWKKAGQRGRPADEDKLGWVLLEVLDPEQNRLVDHWSPSAPPGLAPPWRSPGVDQGIATPAASPGLAAQADQTTPRSSRQGDHPRLRERCQRRARALPAARRRTGRGAHIDAPTLHSNALQSEVAESAQPIPPCLDRRHQPSRIERQGQFEITGAAWRSRKGRIGLRHGRLAGNLYTRPSRRAPCPRTARTIIALPRSA